MAGLRYRGGGWLDTDSGSTPSQIMVSTSAMFASALASVAEASAGLPPTSGTRLWIASVTSRAISAARGTSSAA